jgi:Ketopantoate reductase PanE/ApbA C terminal
VNRKLPTSREECVWLDEALLKNPRPPNQLQRFFCTTPRKRNSGAAAEPGARGSLYHDLAVGRRLELESLNGEVVRRGREYDVSTPLNFAIYAALRPYVDGPPILT